jgi:opacity protein-like surface antigen
MNLTESLGYAAAALVLLTFSMRTMVPLRVAGIASNLFSSPTPILPGRIRSGYNLGVGGSWILAPNWELWVEYDHLHFGNRSIIAQGVGTQVGVPELITQKPVSMRCLSV